MRRSFIVFLTIISLTLLSPPQLFCSEASQEKSFTRPEDAAIKELTGKLAAYFPEFKLTAIEQKESYQGWKGEISFQHLTVKTAEKGRQAEGYLIIGKTAGRPVVQEFCLSSPLQKCSLSRCAEIVDRWLIKDREKDQPYLLYSGPLHYYAVYPIIEQGKQVGQSTVDMLNGKIITSRISAAPPKQDIPVLSAHKKSPRKTTPPRLIEDASQSGLRLLKDAPPYELFLNERTTAVAVVIEYWSRHGFENLIPSDMETLPQEKRVHLIPAIKAGCEKCSEKSTIEIFAASRGYRFQVEESCSGEKRRTTERIFSVLKKEIDNRRPVILKIISRSIDHYAAGVGYWESEWGNFVICLRPKAENSKAGPFSPVFFNCSEIDKLCLVTVHPVRK